MTGLALRCVATMAFVLLATLSSANAQQKLYDDYLYEETRSVAAVDERPITFYLDRPTAGPKVPILLIVDGSGCVGQLRERGRTFWRPGPGLPVRYARLQVEKPGVDPSADFSDTLECSDDFNRNYSITNRVFDHLRVLQHLEANAEWWDGRVYLFGWSDGGDIGAQLLAYRPTITRAVLGAMGGGLTMAEHFEDIWVCPPETTADRVGCLADLRADFKRIADDPSRVEKWNGESRFTWDSRLRSRLIPLLADNRVPLLIVHGENDLENTPVASARALIEGLTAAGNPHFTYWEIEGMAHGWGSLPPAERATVRIGSFLWLFDQPIPPAFQPPLTGRSLPTLPPSGTTR